jgi:RecA/RadA recombinase
MDAVRLILILSNAGIWEDKTEEVAAWTADPGNGFIRVTYKANPGREYPFRFERFRCFSSAATLNPIEVQLRVDGRLLSAVDSIAKFPGYYLVVARGVRELYSASDVSEERDVSVDPSCGAALDYFRAVAELVSVRTDEDQSILASQYKYLRRVSNASVLAAYLTPGSALRNSDLLSPLIFPFGTNASQMAAVESVFRSQVTVVQGPPGTGKTQTILNMVANAIHLGQTVAIVSNNNSATKNVADKLVSRDLGFLVASLGKRDNKAAFIETQCGYPSWVSQAEIPPDQMGRLDERIVSLTETLGRLVRANNDRAALASRIAQLRAEAGLHSRIQGSEVPPSMRPIVDRLGASSVLQLLIECEENGDRSRLSMFGWLKSLFVYGFLESRRRHRLIALGPITLRGLYYEKNLAELEAKLVEAERFLAENDFEAVQRETEKCSWQRLLVDISSRFRCREKRATFTERDLWSKYSQLQQEYPIVLSTTHALKTSLAPDCLYDLVIVDEASQVDIATGVLALSCAKRVAIVGDQAQLPNIIDQESRGKIDALWGKYQPECNAWNYTSHSLLSSVAAMWPEAPNVLLREHYRCHPQIVGFFSPKFYDDKLITMTTDGGESDVMQVIFTVPGNHARGRINQRQIDVIRQEILPALHQAGVTDVGVIAPYRAQVAMLREAVGDAAEVDTVHGFQGREKHAVVLSTVDNQIGEFVDDPKLLNVAVSRAQRRLIVVMADKSGDFTTNFGDLVRYIVRQNQLVVRSKVRSVFDLLYADYEVARQEFLSSNGRGSAWDSECLAEAVVVETLRSREFCTANLACLRHAPLAWLVDDLSMLSEREREFATNPWSHVDLLIYDTIGKIPLVCVEVDGWAFHRPGSLQSVRDEIKDGVLRRAGLPLVRLSTTGSGESAIVSKALRQAIGLRQS